MSKYTLKFDAEFEDGNADLIVKVAEALAEAKSVILQDKIDKLRAELKQQKDLVQEGLEVDAYATAELEKTRAALSAMTAQRDGAYRAHKTTMMELTALREKYRWKPVAECLPTETDYYLVKYADENGETCAYGAENFEQGDSGFSPDVIGWMGIPEGEDHD
jgi:hypothetical protein